MGSPHVHCFLCASRLLFTPCHDCGGSYELRLLLAEQAVDGIPPNTASATVTVTVTHVNDPPVAFVFHNGTDLVPADPAADIVVGCCPCYSCFSSFILLTLWWVAVLVTPVSLLSFCCHCGGLLLSLLLLFLFFHSADIVVGCCCLCYSCFSSFILLSLWWVVVVLVTPVSLLSFC